MKISGPVLLLPNASFNWYGFEINTQTKAKSELTVVLVLSMRAVTALFRCSSLAAASVKTKISEEGGAAVRASFVSHSKEQTAFRTEFTYTVYI